MKIYTRTGDAGQTGIIGGRVNKDDLRVEAYGTVDELNSQLGVCIACLTNSNDADLLTLLRLIQHELFDCGSDLAISPAQEHKGFVIDCQATERLEDAIDRYDEELKPLSQFILPGGEQAAAILHVARTITRRAERRVVSLLQVETANAQIRTYLNRLSDLFFVLARVVNHRHGAADIEYQRQAQNSEVDSGSE